jgi:hypothetical protein
MSHLGQIIVCRNDPPGQGANGAICEYAVGHEASCLLLHKKRLLLYSLKDVRVLSDNPPLSGRRRLVDGDCIDPVIDVYDLSSMLSGGDFG